MAKKASVKLTTLTEAQEFVASVGCGQETHGPNVWRVTHHNSDVLKGVADAFKSAGVWLWPPQTDSPDNAEPDKGREPMEPAVEGYPIGRTDAGVFFLDVGWQYEQARGSTLEVPQLARSKPKPIKIEAMA